MVVFTDGNCQVTEANGIDTPLLRELNQEDIAVVPLVLDANNRQQVGGAVHPPHPSPQPQPPNPNPNRARYRARSFIARTCSTHPTALNGWQPRASGA